MKIGTMRRCLALTITAVCVGLSAGEEANAHCYVRHGIRHCSHHVVLLNDGHYVNVSGHEVHSPTYTLHNEQPPGASARCADGTWSFSEHARGTCSHHGGVAQWL
jgi:hypothetical protein